MWLFWILVFAGVFSLASIFAFPGAVPILAIIILALCVINAPLALRAARNRKRTDDGMTRNWQGEITDLGYEDPDRKIPRSQRAVFFGTPQWKRYEREAGSRRAGAS
jgi:hypothetical protein